MREREIEQEVCKQAERDGWLQFKFSSPNSRGVPDRMFIRLGRVVFVEFKAPGERPTALQNKVISIMREAGAEVAVVDSVAGGRDALS